MTLGRLTHFLERSVDRIVRKRWTDAEVTAQFGNHRQAALSYAHDPATRARAASGGSTSALLIAGLEAGQFDAALVCQTVIEEGRVRARFVLARDAAGVLAARGSKYVETAFLREAVPLLRAFDGRVAVVGLPCDISNLTRLAARDAKLSAKVVCKIALVCGHNSRKELIDQVTTRIERREGSPIRDYRFRVGHWRGRIEAELHDGRTVSLSTRNFNDYQNLFLFCERKCLGCYDHYGYDADITVGDVWLYRLKSHPIKHTGVVTRTPAGDVIYEAGLASGRLHSAAIDVRVIMDGQSRIGPAHYNISARARWAPRFGLKLRDPLRLRVSWSAHLGALMTLALMRLSEKPWGPRLIFALPRPLWRALLILKKGLETLK